MIITAENENQKQLYHMLNIQNAERIGPKIEKLFEEDQISTDSNDCSIFN